MPWYENSNGNRLWYEEHGSGTAIVFIHGWCMSSAIWGLQQEGLSEAFRVITIDLRGHGRSPAPTDGFHIRGCAEDILGLIEHLGLHQAILAGWSLGVQIALQAFQLHSDRVSGLVLISGTPRFVWSQDFPHGLSRVEADGMVVKVRRNIDRALEGFITRMFASGEARSAVVDRLLSTVPVLATAVALQALEALVEADMRDCLARITCPTLIIHGDLDVICLPQASEYLSSHIRNAREVVFSGCGHVPFLTQSCKFNACLSDFRERLTGGVYQQE